MMNFTQMSYRAVLLTAMFAVLAAGCGKKTQPTPQTDQEQGEQDQGGKDQPQSLTMFESAMVGTWSRYHRYDGSTQYFIFNSNRTGSKYEIQNNGSKTDDKTITYWALEDAGGSVFRIRMAGPGISSKPKGYLSSHEFHFAENEIWRGGSSNLRMTKR
jgi:hypothetical protein